MGPIFSLCTTKPSSKSSLNPQTVLAKFVFQPGKKQEFVDMLKTPDGLAKTRAFPGCIKIEAFDDKDDPDTLILWQKWKTKQHHQTYLTMRRDSGLLDKLKDDLAEPLAPLYLDPIP